MIHDENIKYIAKKVGSGANEVIPLSGDVLRSRNISLNSGYTNSINPITIHTILIIIKALNGKPLFSIQYLKPINIIKNDVYEYRIFNVRN
jgi:hypothetical protein